MEVVITCYDLKSHSHFSGMLLTEEVSFREENTNSTYGRRRDNITLKEELVGTDTYQCIHSSLKNTTHRKYFDTDDD